MLTLEELELRREIIDGSPELQALRDRLLSRARATMRKGPPVPTIKGMLTADGGVCPDDGAPLQFDPWSPSAHRCSRCGKTWSGERHNWRWAWHQHLWLAERIAEAASVGLLAGDDELTGWAGGMLLEYAERYFELPNRDNVLGPTRLFSSTYLESIWLTSYVAASFLLREAGVLDEAGLETVSRVIEEAANLIGEFDEGLSNRQTWHNAALASVAVWFGDEDLAQRAITGPRGLVGHLIDGFRGDGLWYEGENYHLFALRGLLIGAGWARQAGVEFFSEEASREKLALALKAPALSALPSGEFPARKDSRFGVSLAQPMYLELWEAGIAGLSQEDPQNAEILGSWLHWLYQAPAPPAQVFDSWLHEAGEGTPSTRTRRDLSWWMLCVMAPELPGSAEAWRPGSVLFPDQGLAILRNDDHYLSLECGPYGGGHGHPDRLHLTLHANGIHWLADPGTGTYVARDLFWYRSTLAHNAPRLDGRSQPEEDARAEMFDEKGRWSWVRGKFGGFTRTVVAGPGQCVDQLEFAAEEEHTVELSWHPSGELHVLSEGRWEATALEDTFVTGAERFVPREAGPVRCRARVDEEVLDIWFDGTGEFIRALAPGRPGESGPRQFLLRRARGRYVRLATLLRWGGPPIRTVKFDPSQIVADAVEGPIVHHQASEGWEVEEGSGRTALKGLRRQLGIGLNLAVPGTIERRFTPPPALAGHVLVPPPLDGSGAGFEGQSLALDHDDQYRRSEEPYPGAEAFSADARLSWDERALYLLVDVVHPEPVFRARTARPLTLDNEVDLIHSDGIQLQLRLPDGRLFGWVVTPDPESSTLQVHPVEGTAASEGQVKGGWHRTDAGYAMTLAIELSGWPPARTDGPLGFDLQVNEMRPDRLRRAGQLVWSGGGGWVYLRGDRQDPTRFGVLELA